MKRGFNLSIITLALLGVGFCANATDEVTVDQHGIQNSAEYRSWGDNSANFSQKGDYNVIKAADVQSINNDLQYSQNGVNNSIVQADFVEKADGHQIKMDQKGFDNRIRFNLGNEAVTGSDFDMVLRQRSVEGAGHLIKLEMDGNSETVRAKQTSGIGPDATGHRVSMTTFASNFNEYKVKQYGSGDSFTYLGEQTNNTLVEAKQKGRDNRMSAHLVDVESSDVQMDQHGQRNASVLNLTGNGHAMDAKVGLNQHGQDNVLKANISLAKSSSVEAAQHGQNNRLVADVTKVKQSDISAEQHGHNNGAKLNLYGPDFKRAEVNAAQFGNGNWLNADVTNALKSSVNSEQRGHENRLTFSVNGVEKSDIDSLQKGHENRATFNLHGPTFKKADVSTTQQGDEHRLTADITNAERSRLVAEQFGQSHNLDLDVDGIQSSKIKSDQRGDGHYAKLWVHGEGESLKMVTRQRGEGQRLNVDVTDVEQADIRTMQKGEQNQATLDLNGKGRGTDVDLFQKGGMNTINLLSTSANLLAEFDQRGEGNRIDIETNSVFYGNYLNVEQKGTGNRLSGEQKWGRNQLTTSQHGEGNVITFRQTSNDNVANFAQQGTGNVISISQF
ncbi:hypothetical protein [Ferrimonas sp.]|uniref:hypothetical protein n=1 Tax=Ferrimonas sp. TaxID=2080861 RepID=UPI003A9036BC